MVDMISVSKSDSLVTNVEIGPSSDWNGIICVLFSYWCPFLLRDSRCKLNSPFSTCSLHWHFSITCIGLTKMKHIQSVVATIRKYIIQAPYRYEVTVCASSIEFHVFSLFYIADIQGNLSGKTTLDIKNKWSCQTGWVCMDFSGKSIFSTVKKDFFFQIPLYWKIQV